MKSGSVQLPRKVRGFRASTINALIDYCQSITLLRSPGCLINRYSMGTQIGLTSGGGSGIKAAGLPYLETVPGSGAGDPPTQIPLNTSAWCFGYGIAAGTSVPVTLGTLWVGIPAYTYAGGNVTVADGQVIGWEWAGSSISVLAGAQSYFVDDEETLRGWFHKWTVAGGVAKPALIGHLGNLKFPGNYAVHS